MVMKEETWKIERNGNHTYVGITTVEILMSVTADFKNLWSRFGNDTTSSLLGTHLQLIRIEKTQCGRCAGQALVLY